MKITTVGIDLAKNVGNYSADFMTTIQNQRSS